MAQAPFFRAITSELLLENSLGSEKKRLSDVGAHASTIDRHTRRLEAHSGGAGLDFSTARRFERLVGQNRVRQGDIRGVSFEARPP